MNVLKIKPNSNYKGAIKAQSLWFIRCKSFSSNLLNFGSKINLRKAKIDR